MTLPASRLGLVLYICMVALSLGKQNVKKCNKPCTVKSTPVCGNDGRNYTTRCHLSVARCEGRKIGQIITVASNGTCAGSKPFSPCDWNCSQGRQKYTICASNKVTYKNLCQFKKAKCEARKKKLKPLRILGRVSCSKLQTKTLKCRDNSTCPKVRRPVCGTNRVTYQNICHLKTANCIMKREGNGKKYKKLTLKHCGPCNRPWQCNSSPWEQKCASTKMCDQMLRAMRPVSRKNGGNLKKDAKKKNKKSKKKDKGKTKRGFPLKGKKDKTKKKITSKPTKGGKRGVYPKFRKFMVCGSDRRTYPSICHLQVEQCNKRNRCQRLTMRSRGPCKH